MENINQTPNLQPIQIQEPVKNSNVFKYLFIISIVVLLGVILGFYYILNNKISKLGEEKTAEVTNQITVEPTAEPTISQDSTLSTLNTNNNLYTNNKFGFSLTIPKKIEEASCQKNGDSYSLNGVENSENVPFVFFENKDTIYLAGEYFNKLTGEQKIPQGQGYISKFSGCQKITNTFEEITKGYFSSSRMKIYAADIKNDSELLQFIQSKYGSACRLGEKTQSTTAGIFDIKILGDGKGLDESLCAINFAIKTIYNQNKSKLVIFELGQACNLYTNNTCNDFNVVNSLKFN